MEVNVSGEMFGVHPTVLIALRIQSMIINEEKQQVVFSILREELVGNNLLGRIVCSLASCFFSNFSRKAIDRSAWKDHVSFSKECDTITVDLAGIPAVETMKTNQIPNWNGSVPLRLIGIQNAEHEDGGIVLLLTVAEGIERIVDTIGSNLFGFERRKESLSDNPSAINEIVNALKLADSRARAYEILDAAVARYSDFYLVDDTEFMGAGYYFFVTLTQYCPIQDLDGICKKTNRRIVELIPIKNSDRTIIVSRESDRDE